jgi:hypothetical protein
MPTLSVIVASRLDRSDLEACLEALLPSCASVGAEVVVVRTGTSSEVTSLARVHGAARFVQAPHDATMRQLRGIGMAEATGDIVAITDEMGATPHWIGLLLRRASDAAPEVAAPAPVDWDAYFSERGLFAGLRPGAEA